MVAFPGSVWHKKARERKLPAGTLQKSLSVQVGGCSFEDRLAALDGIKINVWLGWLAAGSYEAVSFDTDAVNEAASNFVFEDKDSRVRCLPFAEALAKAAAERFGVRIPGDDVAPGQEEEEEEVDRVGMLESKISSLEMGLQEVLDAVRGGSGFATGREENSAQEEVRRKLALKTGLAAPAKMDAPQKATGYRVTYPGLDPNAVSVALQAGVPAEHIEAMSKVAAHRPPRLQDAPNQHRREMCWTKRRSRKKKWS